MDAGGTMTCPRCGLTMLSRIAYGSRNLYCFAEEFGEFCYKVKHTLTRDLANTCLNIYPSGTSKKTFTQKPVHEDPRDMLGGKHQEFLYLTRQQLHC